MIAEGWISVPEMELVKKYMTDNTQILEVGAANGRLFSYLNTSYPNATYHAVDPWEQEKVRLQVDWDKGYFEEGNLKEIITLEMFKVNCPFATAYEMYFDDFVTDQKYDIVSLGLVSSSVDWKSAYIKAFDLVKNNGYVIGRNLTHSKYGSTIHEVIKDYKMIDQTKGSFVLRKLDV